MMACGSSRTAVKVQDSRFVVQGYETRDTVREQVMVEERDTLCEITTITITQNENGDTLRMVQVTERDRFRDRAAVKDKEEKLVVRTDTVYVTVRDSVAVTNTNCTNPTDRASPLQKTLRLVLWIIVGLIVLVIVIKIKN